VIKFGARQWMDVPFQRDPVGIIHGFKQPRARLPESHSCIQKKEKNPQKE
jgi:hypothetical protein